MMTPRSMALVARLLGRGDWGLAMLAESEQVPRGRARRGFVRGCVRALVLSLPALAGVAIGAGLLSVVLVATAFVRYPGLATGMGTWIAVALFLSVVVAYVEAIAALAVRLVGPRTLLVAAVLAAGVSGSWLAVGFSAFLGMPDALSMSLVALGPGVALVAGRWMTSRSGSPLIAMQSVGLASLLAGFLLFLLWTGETVAFDGRPYDAGPLRDFRSSGAGNLATYAVNDSLGTGMMLLLLVPVVSVAAGLTGVALGARRPHAGPD